MALILADRVRDTTTTTGTGTVTLSGTAPTGYQNFSVIGNGNTTYYTINAGSQWEVGIGTYSDVGPTLARTTVLESSNGGALVNFSAGVKDVFVTYPADEVVIQDGATIAAGTAVLGVANGGTGLSSTPANGAIDIGNGTGFTRTTLTAGTNISITNGAGSITINATDQFVGTVTSVAASGGTTGMTFSGSPITTSGTLTLGGTLNVANGGTGATTLSSGYLLKGNGTSAVSASVIFDNGTNAGIGTTTPQAPLAIGSGSASASNPTYGGSLLIASQMSSLAQTGGIEFRAVNFASGYGHRVSSPDLGAGDTPLVFERRTNSVSWTESMRINSSGNVIASVDVRAPIYYDSNNTAFYLDPTGSTSLNAAGNLVTSGNVILNFGANRYVRIGSSTNYSYDLQTTGDDFQIIEAGVTPRLTIKYPSGNVLIGTTVNYSRLTVSNGNSTRSGITISDANTASLMMFAGASSNAVIAIDTNSLVFKTGATAGQDNGTDRLTISSAGNVIANVDFRAPIYYDSQDTSYYVDPHQTSRLFNLTVVNTANFAGGSAVSSFGDFYARRSGGSDGVYYFVDGGNKYLYWDGSRYLFGSAGPVDAAVSYRAPIFYDSNNTAFYTDPASTSVLNALTVNGGATYRSDWTTRFQSNSDFVSGTLVSTDIPATAENGDSFVIEITGKSYDGSNPPFKVVAQGYLYANTIINYSGINYGGTFSSYIRVFQDGGVLKFWWPRISYWNSFNVNVMSMDGPTNGTITRNRVTSITDSVEPTGTKKQTITLNQALRENVWINNKYFGSDGAIYGTIFYDSNNSAYYVDGASHSYLNTLGLLGGLSVLFNNPADRVDGAPWYGIGGMSDNLRVQVAGFYGLRLRSASAIVDLAGDYAQANGSFRAPIFYDSNNTAYFLDPNTTGNALRTAGWWQQDSTAWGGDIGGKIQYHGNNWYFNAANEFIFRASNGSQPFYVTQAGVAVAQADMRAPIFYDLNNTGFYVDPTGTSVLNTVNLSRINMANSNSVYADGDGNAGWRFGGTGYVYLNQAGLTYAQTAIVARGGVSNDSAGLLTLLGGTSGGTQINTDTRSPIYYDSNNTGFYLDPNGNSVLANVSLGGQTWRNDITWNNGVNIFANGENSFDVASGATWGVWDTPTGNYMISAAANNQVQIGAAGSRGLYVWGAITATGNVTAFSDIRVKDNVEQIGGALDRLQAIRGVIYTRNDLEDKERRYAGVIAQEIEQVLPEAVFDNGDRKAVDYNATIGLLIEAIKELTARVAELEGK